MSARRYGDRQQTTPQVKSNVAVIRPSHLTHPTPTHRLGSLQFRGIAMLDIGGYYLQGL